MERGRLEDAAGSVGRVAKQLGRQKAVLVGRGRQPKSGADDGGAQLVSDCAFLPPLGSFVVFVLEIDSACVRGYSC